MQRLSRTAIYLFARCDFWHMDVEGTRRAGERGEVEPVAEVLVQFERDGDGHFEV